MFSVLDTLAVTIPTNSGNGRPEDVCHLLSSCEHASITSKSDSKVFEFSDKFQRCAVVREGGNCRVTPAEEDHDFCFVSVELEPFEKCIVIEFVQLELQKLINLLGLQKKAFSQEVRLLACIQKAISSWRKTQSSASRCLLFWLEKVGTSWAPVCGNRDAYSVVGSALMSRLAIHFWTEGLFLLTL